MNVKIDNTVDFIIFIFAVITFAQAVRFFWEIVFHYIGKKWINK